MTLKTYAGIDLGSNSCKILICNEKGEAVYQNNYSTRLAEGLAVHNLITPEAFDRAQECFFEYRQALDKYNVEPQNMRAVTTATCRMASNGAELVKKIYDESHINLEIIDGREEAELNLKGAMSHVLGKSKYVVIYDLGGGSTEVTLATNKKVPEILNSVSIPWGARNASEAFGLVEYSKEKAEKLEKEVNGYMDQFLQGRELPDNKDISFVVTSSTPLRLVSMINQFGDYKRERADGLSMTRSEADKAIESVLYSSREELADNPYIGDKRSYIFIAACVIFKTIYDRLGADKMTASLKSAKDGIVAGLIERDQKQIQQQKQRNNNGKVD